MVVEGMARARGQNGSGPITWQSQEAKFRDRRGGSSLM